MPMGFPRIMLIDMNYPKISVITPSYNQGKFLEETILSIINQGYPNLEFIIMDGGSKDNSIDIIKKYESSIAYWVSEKDRGQSHAMNKGIEIATGDIVSTIFSDDLLLPGALLKVAEEFNDAPDNVSIIHGGTVLFNSRKDLGEEWGPGNPSYERYLSGLCFSHTAGFVKKKYLDIVGFYNEKRHYGMDYDLYSRLLLVSRFRRTNHLLSKYRFHDDSKTVALTDRFTGDWIQAFVNLVDNANLTKVKVELLGLKIFDEYFKVTEKFSFPFSTIHPDEKEVAYYFLTDIMRADYRNGNLDRAKLLAKHIVQNHNIRMESDVPLIIHRLTHYPLFLIAAAKKIKSYIN